MNRPMNRPAGRRLRGIAYTVLALAVVVIWFLPFYWAASLSIRSKAEAFTVTGLAIPFVQYRPTLENWQEQLAVPETTRALVNSTVIAFSASLLTLVLGTPAAYALARFRFSPKLAVILSFVLCLGLGTVAVTLGAPPGLVAIAGLALFLVLWFVFARRPGRTLGNEDLTLWFLSQRFLPPVATVVPFLLIMSQLKLIDTRLSLILVNITFNLPFAIVIMRQAFLDLPIELEEAALVDGASTLRAFTDVALRLATPAMAATLMIVLAFSWNEFLFALTLGTLKAKTIPVLMAGAVDTRGIQFWFVAVRTLLAIVPPTVLALLAQRYIVRGLTFGAVKG